MATSPPKLLRALVDYYQGGVKIYAADNVYPESDALRLMKARGEAEVPKPTAKPRGTKVAGEPGDKPEDGSTAMTEPGPESGSNTAAADQAQPEQGSVNDTSQS